MSTEEKQPLKQWTWKATVNGDPCTFYCDLTQDLQLDFYGDSHHPLWKGWFDVGRQSPADLVLDGPLPAAHMKDTMRTKITQYLQKHYANQLTAEKRTPPPQAMIPEGTVAASVEAVATEPALVPGNSAWLSCTPTAGALITSDEKAYYEHMVMWHAKDPVLYPLREPNPLTGNDALLEIILEIPRFPEEQLTDASLGVGDAWLYERHMFELGSPLRQSARVLAFQGPVAAGEYILRLTAQCNTPATGDNPSVNLECRLVIERGKLCAYAVRLAEQKADVVTSAVPVAAEVEIRLGLSRGRRFESCRVWLGDLLLFDEAATSATYHRQRMRPEIQIAGLSEICVFKGHLPAGPHTLRCEAHLITEGEVDARRATWTESIELGAGVNFPLIFQVPETVKRASPEQKAKLRRIQALREEIIMKFKAGAEYYEGDKEGGWLRIYFHDGAFQHESGSYADGVNHGANAMKEDKIVDRLLELNAIYLRDRPMEDKLINLRDSLRAK